MQNVVQHRDIVIQSENLTVPCNIKATYYLPLAFIGRIRLCHLYEHNNVKVDIGLMQP